MAHGHKGCPSVHGSLHDLLDTPFFIFFARACLKQDVDGASETGPTIYFRAPLFILEK
jgi:hypothetical protein